MYSREEFNEQLLIKRQCHNCILLIGIIYTLVRLECYLYAVVDLKVLTKQSLLFLVAVRFKESDAQRIRSLYTM